MSYKSKDLDEAIWRGGALCASINEAALIIGFECDNQGERIDFHVPELGMRAEILFEMAPPYTWSFRVY
jgi:hypothetical protein